MSGMPFSSLNNAVLLISLGFGYIVYYLANREEKALRRIGIIIGIFIMALSIVYIITNLILTARLYSQVGIMMPQWHSLHPYK